MQEAKAAGRIGVHVSKIEITSPDVRDQLRSRRGASELLVLVDVLEAHEDTSSRIRLNADFGGTVDLKNAYPVDAKDGSKLRKTILKALSSADEEDSVRVRCTSTHPTPLAVMRIAPLCPPPRLPWSLSPALASSPFTQHAFGW